MGSFWLVGFCVPNSVPHCAQITIAIVVNKNASSVFIFQSIFENFFAYHSFWLVLAMVIIIFFQILAIFFYISHLTFLFSDWPRNGHVICCGSFIGTHRPDQNKWCSLTRLVAKYASSFYWSGLVRTTHELHRFWERHKLFERFRITR